MMYAMKLMHQTILRLLAAILMTAGLFGGVRCYAYDWSGSGTTSDPYLIEKESDWDEMCNYFNSYYTKSFKLTADLSVTIAFGNGYNTYSGTFDGNGHTIEFIYTASSSNTALFRLISNATITNLRVKGSITVPANCKFAGGIVGWSQLRSILRLLETALMEE